MPKRGAPQKKVEDYLVPPAAKATSLDDYMSTPASAFLRSVCEAFDAFELCRNRFVKKKNGQYNKDSDDSLRYIGIAVLATTMGHFETYQKGLFAGVFERSRHFVQMTPLAISKKLNNPSLSLERLCAYRGAQAPVGLSVADALPSWHDPDAVNSRFKAFGMKMDFFSNDDVATLRVLWQLRHSIVHTGAWLTKPDAQKVPALKEKGDEGVAFDHMFVNALSRRFHKVVKEANRRLEAGVRSLLAPDVDAEILDDLKHFLSVESPKSNWLS
ncbi:hypothetical protein [Enhygromyxa salina]|uniref:hypothetical protein n=1 Tax=Enhygromyxa salina TaxID=215803 RepID=UPI0011BA7BB8|nr:hypothetical protein [Enhygromyxa salina]